MKQGCPAIQYNTKVPDYSCGKEQGHSGGHVDPATQQPWGTPARPYGMRGAKAARKRKVK
jgi:hypothetical protein